jgi:hypothetical protein
MSSWCVHGQRKQPIKRGLQVRCKFRKTILST